MVRPLEGTLILEATSYAYVPPAGAILAEWGADVIKIEHPRRPDPMQGTTAQESSGCGRVYFLSECTNGGRRGVASIPPARKGERSSCPRTPLRPDALRGAPVRSAIEPDAIQDGSERNG
jgi:hypothetical protein